MPTRPIDYTEVKRRHDAGDTITAIAADLGVARSTLSEGLKRAEQQASQPPADGDTPRVSLEGDTGTAVSRVYDETTADSLTPEDLLRGWKLSPTEWEIVDGTVGVNRWMSNAVIDGEWVETWNYQYKARVRRAGTGPEDVYGNLPTITVREHRYQCPVCRKGFDRSRVGTVWCSAVCRKVDPWRTSQGIVRHVIIPDTQVRPDEPTDHLVWAGQYIREHCQDQPTRIVHIGDHWDMAALSMYDVGKKSAEGRRVLADLEAGNRAFQVLDEAMGPTPTDANGLPLWDLHFLFGNHEDRIDRHVEANAALEGFLSLDNCVTPDRWQRHTYLEPVELDGVWYAHYFYVPNTGRPYAGDNIQDRIRKVGQSFVMGHQQGLQLGATYDLTGRQRIGLVAGSFYQHDESYKGPQGNSHWRGIVVLNNVDAGSADPMPLSLDYLCRRYAGHRIAEHEGIVV